jgi:hypothetical protein
MIQQLPAGTHRPNPSHYRKERLVPLTDRHTELLHLAGTVRLPSPPPATGTVSIADFNASTLDPASIVLRLTHKVSDSLDLSRLIHLTDVRGIRALWEPPSLATPHPARTFKKAAEVVAAAVAFLKATPNNPIWLTEAVVYVGESTPLVLVVEAALSAAESAEYYPPIVRKAAAACGAKFHAEACN